MISKFERDTALDERDGRLFAEFSDDWAIWGPNGGYAASIALRAAGRIAPSDHHPATISCQYLSNGQFAEVEVHTEAVRKGRTAWCIDVVLSQNQRRILQAQVWTTNKTEGPVKVDRKMPEVALPANLKSWSELFPGSPARFPFWRNFESKPVTLVDKGKADPRGSVNQDWYRFRDFSSTCDVYLDFARALVMIDTYPWLAFIRGLDALPDYFAPTLDVTAWFHTPPGGSDWLLADSRADVAGGGLIHGSVHVWTEDGRLIASGGSNLLHVAQNVYDAQNG